MEIGEENELSLIELFSERGRKERSQKRQKEIQYTHYSGSMYYTTEKGRKIGGDRGTTVYREGNLGSKRAQAHSTLAAAAQRPPTSSSSSPLAWLPPLSRSLPYLSRTPFRLFSQCLPVTGRVYYNAGLVRDVGGRLKGLLNKFLLLPLASSHRKVVISNEQSFIT